MPLRINDNPSSSFVLNQLSDSSKALNKSLARLSSGSRITQAADDASGLVIANSLRSQALGIGQAMRNANDAISVVQVADAALGEATALVDTIRTKSLQAANDTQTADSRQALQTDINRALGQLDTLAKTTTFNDQKLLSGNFTNREFQIGSEPGQTVQISIGSAEPGMLGSQAVGTLSDINVMTQEGAQTGVQVADAALAQIDMIRSGIGAKQNQIASTINSLSATQVNIQAAASTISDVDFAEEAMNFAQIKALNQAKTFALAQAKNVNKDTALTLLQG